MKSMIMNLTQHAPTPEQVTEGVAPASATVQALLMFEATRGDQGRLQVPPMTEVRRRAETLANLAAESGASRAMIGGASFLMGPLEAALIRKGIEPLYSFSARESVEEAQADGSVKKISSHRHIGFMNAAPQQSPSLEQSQQQGTAVAPPAPRRVYSDSPSP